MGEIIILASMLNIQRFLKFLQKNAGGGKNMPHFPRLLHQKSVPLVV